MRIDILTLFPEMFSSLNHALLGKALAKNVLTVNCVNIRDYSADKHQKCDDTPFGGGVGMLMTAQPIHDCIQAVDPNHEALRIYLSPQGKKLNQSVVRELSNEKRILILCGHYEGVDQRVIDLDIDTEISIGDYITSGGEYPAMVLVDCISRYVPDVLGNSLATEEESFSASSLEYKQYTHPREFLGLSVPEVLVSGNHQKISEWKKQSSREVTAEKRPDLLNGDDK